MIIWVQVIATGKVQGVFYRDSARREALRLGLTGWVRNMPGGSVEARLEGTEEQVEAMLGWMRDGPPLARVDAVTIVAEGKGKECSSFEVLR